MQSFGTFAALGSAGLSQIASHLPWGWFGLLASIDAGLVVLMVRRRGRDGMADTTLPGPVARAAEGWTLVDGWWVPRSRSASLAGSRRAYAWPLHSEYILRRLA